MTWKELYEANKNRKTQIVEVIHGDFIIKARFKNFLKRYPYLIIISSFVIILLFVLCFYQNLRAMLSCFLLLSILLVLGIFFNSFSIIGKKKEITIKENGQEIVIPYHSLKNLYLQETSFRIFFKKYYQYSLVLLYESFAHHICDITLSTNLLEEKEIENLFAQIEIKDCPVNYQAKCIKDKKRRFLKKAILFILLTVLAFLLSFLK